MSKAGVCLAAECSQTGCLSVPHVSPQESPMETRVLAVQDLDWSFWPAASPVLLVAPGMCPACLRAGAGHRCLGKFLPAGIPEPTGSCRLRDLAWCLVSQKAFFLGSRGCAPAWPCNHRAPGRAAVCFPEVHAQTVSACVCRRRQGPGGAVQVPRFLITACI